MPVTVTLTDHGLGVVLKTVAPVSGDEVAAAIESFLRDETAAGGSHLHMKGDEPPNKGG